MEWLGGWMRGLHGRVYLGSLLVSVSKYGPYLSYPLLRSWPPGCHTSPHISSPDSCWTNSLSPSYGYLFRHLICNTTEKKKQKQNKTQKQKTGRNSKKDKNSFLLIFLPKLCLLRLLPHIGNWCHLSSSCWSQKSKSAAWFFFPSHSTPVYQQVQPIYLNLSSFLHLHHLIYHFAPAGNSLVGKLQIYEMLRGGSSHVWILCIFIPQIFIEYLLCPRHWGYHSEPNILPWAGRCTVNTLGENAGKGIREMASGTGMTISWPF